MAQKRMFDKDVIGIDSFLDLPMEAKALYFLLGIEADDEGFINPKKVVRLYGGNEDSIKILILKGFLIPFRSGVVVITDWKRNNYLDKTRVKETIYQDEKAQIEYDEMTQKYQCLTDVKQMLKQNRIVEYSIEENIKEKNKQKRKIFTKPTVEEIQTYCNERKNGINAEAFYDFYESKNWYVGKNKMQDWKACVRTWEQRNQKTVAKISPEWLNKEIQPEIASNEEQKEIDEFLKDFN